MSSTKSPAATKRSSERLRNKGKDDKEGNATEGEKAIAKKRVVGEDHLSKLSDDCIRDVFGRLDFNDLDQISVSSERMEALATVSRPWARKVKAEELLIDSMYDGSRLAKITINCDADGTHDTITATNADHDCEICQELIEAKKVSETFPILALHQVFEIAEAAIKRYDFKFVAIDILQHADLSYHIEFFTRHLHLSEPDELRVLIDFFYTVRQTRLAFMDWLLSTKSKSIDMSTDTFDCDLLGFLEKYTNTVNAPSLRLHEYSDLRIAVSRDQLAIIGKFANFSANVIRFEEDQIMPTIIIRHRMQRGGEFSFHMAQDFDNSILAAGLEPSMKGEWQGEYSFNISENGRRLIEINTFDGFGRPSLTAKFLWPPV